MISYRSVKGIWLAYAFIEVFWLMERIAHKSTSFTEAEDWDIAQNKQMTFSERLRVADELKRRFYGGSCPDVRETRVCVIRKR